MVKNSTQATYPSPHNARNFETTGKEAGGRKHRQLMAIIASQQITICQLKNELADLKGR